MQEKKNLQLGILPFCKEEWAKNLPDRCQRLEDKYAKFLQVVISVKWQNDYFWCQDVAAFSKMNIISI